MPRTSTPPLLQRCTRQIDHGDVMVIDSWQEIPTDALDAMESAFRAVYYISVQYRVKLVQIGPESNIHPTP